MAALRWLLMMSAMATIILVQGLANAQGKNNVKDCEEGQSCTDKKNCPEYLKFKTMTDQSERREMKQILIGKICNRKPNRLCCKVKGATTTTPTTPTPRPKFYLPGVGQCGVSLSAKSVIHGEDAILGEFPWAALLGTEETFEHWDNRQKIWTKKTETLYQCGGTLINTWYVLTAAHCQTENKMIVEVVLGEWDIFSDPDCPRDEDQCDNPKAQRRKVAEVIKHSGYVKKFGPNDIALIRMKTEVQLNRFVQLACLPLPEYNLPVYFYNPVFLNATVVGWGQTSNKKPSKKDLIYHGLTTNRLQKGRMPIQPLEQCRKANPRKEIQSSQLCAGADKLNSKRDSCKGDSGGGLFVDSGEHSGASSGNRHIQVGLVSYGAPMCGDYPGVYTRVDQFIPWIKNVIGF